MASMVATHVRKELQAAAERQATESERSVFWCAAPDKDTRLPRAARLTCPHPTAAQRSSKGGAKADKKKMRLRLFRSTRRGKAPAIVAPQGRSGKRSLAALLLRPSLKARSVSSPQTVFSGPGPYCCRAGAQAAGVDGAGPQRQDYRAADGRAAGLPGCVAALLSASVSARPWPARALTLSGDASPLFPQHPRKRRQKRCTRSTLKS